MSILYFVLCVKNPNLSLQIAKIKILTLRSRNCEKQFNLPWSNVKSSNFRYQESKWPKCPMLTKLWLSLLTIKLEFFNFKKSSNCYILLFHIKINIFKHFSKVWQSLIIINPSLTLIWPKIWTFNSNKFEPILWIFWITFRMTTHRFKSNLKQARYHKNNEKVLKHLSVFR